MSLLIRPNDIDPREACFEPRPLSDRMMNQMMAAYHRATIQSSRDYAEIERHKAALDAMGVSYADIAVTLPLAAE